LCLLLCVAEQSRQLPHVAKHDRARALETGGRRHAARIAEYGHACGARGLDTDRAVLDDRAVGGRDAHPRRRVQEEVGRRFATQVGVRMRSSASTIPSTG